MTDQGMDDFTVDDLVKELIESIARLRQVRSNLEFQRSVCLATRSLDSCFYAESIFEEELNEQLAVQIQQLYETSLEVLPSDTQSYQSVQMRLSEFLKWTDEMRTGVHVEITV